MQFSKTIVYKLHQIIYSLDAQANQVLATNFDISYDDFMVLNLIYNYPQINQQNLAATLRLGKSAISQRLNKLEQRNFLKRKASNNSRRENKLGLTSKGTDMFLKASGLLDKNSNEIFQHLKDAKKFDTELDIIIKAMEKIYN
jgi:MarR family transcriptional regulator, organic hydroperoxide resistance regulator